MEQQGPDGDGARLRTTRGVFNKDVLTYGAGVAISCPANNHEDVAGDSGHAVKPLAAPRVTVALNAVECLESGESTTEALELAEEVETPTSAECNMREVQVNEVFNGCEYSYVSGLVNFVGTTSITCPAGKKIEYQTGGCTVTIGEQKGLSSVTFKNIANGGLESEKEATAEIKVANLKYEEDNVAPGNTCKNAGVLQENGSMIGPETLTDENAKNEMKGFWVA